MSPFEHCGREDRNLVRAEEACCEIPSFGCHGYQIHKLAGPTVVTSIGSVLDEAAAS